MDNIDIYHGLNDDMTTTSFGIMAPPVSWAKKNNKISKTYLPHGFEVSTIFLRINHNHDFPGDKRPVLFETAVFNEKLTKDLAEFDMRRYHTYDEALAGHEQIVKEWLEKIRTMGVEAIKKEHDYLFEEY